ncbi:MAG: malonyl-ACP O-methyltransferase BioC [Bacteroidales bacterium]
MNKTLLGKRFEKAAKSYNESAKAQACIADSLWRLIRKNLHAPPTAILEIGCGTGLLTRHYLQTENCSFTLNDLYHPDLCLPQHTSVNFVQGDAENMDWQDQKWSLILSASTVQWFTDLGRFIKRMAHSLEKDGLLAFSTFGNHNYKEFKSLNNDGLNYLTLQDITAIIGTEYEILHQSEDLIELEFDSVKDIFRHIKATGVSGCNSKRLMPGELKSLEQKYSELWKKENGKLSLTYHPLFFVLRKK